MTENRGILSIILAFCLLLTAFCSTTTMEYVWKDPNYQGGKLNKVLIIGVAREQANRILFENQFVEALQTHGTDAIASYTIIPSTENLDKATVESKIKTLAVEAVLVTKLVNVKKDRTPARITDSSSTQPRLRRGGWVDYSTHYELAQEQGSS